MRRLTAAALACLLAVLAPPLPAALGGSSPPSAEDAIVGISVRGSHRAYPTRLFAGRRVVNDVIGELEIAVFHDPGSGLSTAWFRMVFGEPIEFSGEAVGSVADDLTTITRWDLETGEAVGGNLEGQRLVRLDAITTSWAGWTTTHPDAELYGDSR